MTGAMLEKPFTDCEGCCQWCMSQSCPERFAHLINEVSTEETNDLQLIKR